jgi:hypothetical protein
MMVNGKNGFDASARRTVQEKCERSRPRWLREESPRNQSIVTELNRAKSLLSNESSNAGEFEEQAKGVRLIAELFFRPSTFQMP